MLLAYFSHHISISSSMGSLSRVSSW